MQILQGPKKGVRRVAFSPDGKQLAAGCYDKSLRVWNLATGEERKLAGCGATPNSIAWSVSGQELFWSICPHDTGTAASVALSDGQVRVLETAQDMAAVCPSPDGEHLYVASADGILRWSLKEGVSRLADRPALSPGFLAISSDSRTLASTHPVSPLAQIRHETQGHWVTLWDNDTGLEVKRLLECSNYFDAVGFSPDGTRLVAVGHQSIWLWELPSGRPLVHHPSKKFLTDLAWSPLGTVFATSGNDGEIRFWDGRSGSPSGVYSWGLTKALCVAFAPDGMRAAAGDSTGKIVVWDVEQ